MTRFLNTNTNINECMERLMNSPIPERNKKLVKVNDTSNDICDDTSNDNNILDYNDYMLLLKNDYKIPFLKQNLKYYHLSRMGNKITLIARLYNHLYLSSRALSIQSIFRRFIVKEYTRLHGYNYREECINERDMTTMEEIRIIPFHQFYLVKENNKYYGFDIITIYNLFIQLTNGQINGQSNIIENPYTKTVFPDNEFQKILKLLRYGDILGFKINTYFEDLEPVDYVDNINIRLITIFNEINNLGNYANIEWFNTLNSGRLISFITELRDIWAYRANLSDTVKYDICPPFGNPFRGILLTALPIMDYIFIKNICVKIMEAMIMRCVNPSSKSLGAYYVLACLTLVNKDAANALPWLYQSVSHE